MPNENNPQLAISIIDQIYISQGEYGSFTHYAGSSQELAIDFRGWDETSPPRIERYPLYAPFDCRVTSVWTAYAQVNWVNTVWVEAANGEIFPPFTLSFTIIHDWDYPYYAPGQNATQGQLFHHTGNATGTSGTSTADHTHLQFVRGSTMPWPIPVSQQLHIYDIMDVAGVTMYEGYNYPWIADGDWVYPDPDFPDDPDSPITRNERINIINSRRFKARQDMRRRR